MTITRIASVRIDARRVSVGWHGTRGNAGYTSGDIGNLHIQELIRRGHREDVPLVVHGVPFTEIQRILEATS